MSDKVLDPESISVNGTATTQEEAIREAASILVAAGAVTDGYVDYMLEREKSVSTYMGNFLPFPTEQTRARTRS